MTPDFVVMAVQLIFGFIIKKWPKVTVTAKKLIPVFNLIIAILIEVIKAVTVNADTLDVATEPPHSPSFWAKLFKAILRILITTGLSTGIHSGVKNVSQAIKGE